MSDDNNDAYEYEEGQVTQWDGGDDPVPVNQTDAFTVIGKIFSYAKEKQITKREIARYHAMRDVAITKIIKECEVKREFINKSFEERRKSIEKCFEVIDKGLENKNYELVSNGLASMAEIVKSSPFKIFQLTTLQERHKMLENGEI